MLMMNGLTFTCGLLPALFCIGFVSSVLAAPIVSDIANRNILRFVQDPDGHSNVRSGASLKAPIIGKVMSGMPVFVMPVPKSEFYQVLIDHAMDKRDSFVHASRLKPIATWKAFGPGDRPGVVKHNGFEAIVKSVPFIESQNRVTRDAHGMVIVNGKSPWGRDGGMPSFSLSLEVFLNGKKIELPLDATDNLYEPYLKSLVLFTPGDPSQRAILTMVNSDGAGCYYVAWGFENGIYRGRSVGIPW
jgi:hypothetical protein